MSAKTRRNTRRHGLKVTVDPDTERLNKVALSSAVVFWPSDVARYEFSISDQPTHTAYLPTVVVRYLGWDSEEVLLIKFKPNDLIQEDPAALEKQVRESAQSFIALIGPDL